MTKEDIIHMAHNAGFEHIAEADYWHPLFERFAALVASSERERISKKLEQLPFGDTAASFAIYVREL